MKNGGKFDYFCFAYKTANQIYMEYFMSKFDLFVNIWFLSELFFP